MISDNINTMREKVARSCVRAGRSPSDVTLIAVAKTFPAEAVREAFDAGAADVGENYVQEVLAKRRELAGLAVRWHFIGHLQTNKVKQIAPWVHMIHAVDSVPLATEIDRRASGAGRVIECLIEVNTTGEETKFGVPPGALSPRSGRLTSHVPQAARIERRDRRVNTGQRPYAASVHGHDRGF